MENPIDYLNQEVGSLKHPHTKKAVEFFTYLTKAIKAKLVYPSSSKLPEQFKNEFVHKTTEIFQDIEFLSFKISSNNIKYGDNVVYESTSRTENFAHVFFRDGIINLSFYGGIDDDELGRFIELLAKMMRTVFVDDDLSTLMWEENFQFITYELIDDDIEIDTVEYSTENLRSGKNLSHEDIASLFIDEGEITFDEEDFVQAGQEMELRRKGKSFANMPKNTHDFLNRITEFTSEEDEQISMLVTEDSKFDHTEYILVVIFEILGMEKELPGYTETLSFISKVRDNFINLGNFSGAAALLDRMKEMHGVLKNLSSPRAQKLEEFFLDCASIEKVALITEIVNKIKDIDTEGLTSYLKNLPWAAIDPLIKSLGDLKFYKARRVVCAALAELGRGHTNLIAPGLDDERWYVVRNIVMILGKIGSPDILNYLKKTIKHEDYRVRKETINAAAAVESADSSDFMIMALTDPDSKIQMSSLRHLIDKNVTRAFKPIENIVNDKKFKSRPPEQISRYLKAYALLGQDKALAYLKPLAGKRNFLASAKDERMKIMAIMALGKIRTTESIKTLNKIAKTKKGQAAAAAMKVLNVMTKEAD